MQDIDPGHVARGVEFQLVGIVVVISPEVFQLDVQPFDVARLLFHGQIGIQDNTPRFPVRGRGRLFIHLRNPNLHLVIVRDRGDAVGYADREIECVHASLKSGYVPVVVKQPGRIPVRIGVRVHRVNVEGPAAAALDRIGQLECRRVPLAARGRIAVGVGVEFHGGCRIAIMILQRHVIGIVGVVRIGDGRDLHMLERKLVVGNILIVILHPKRGDPLFA